MKYNFYLLLPVAIALQYILLIFLFDSQPTKPNLNNIPVIILPFSVRNALPRPFTAGSIIFFFLENLAANHISLSFFNSSDAYCNALPFLFAAANLISLSFFNSSDAYCNARPFCVTAANTISLSFFNSSDA